MNFIEEKVIKILAEKGIKEPEYPDKMNYVKFKYPVKDEITGKILEYREISGKDFEKLGVSKRKKIRETGEEIFDEKSYNNNLKKYEEEMKKYKEEYNKVIKEIVDENTYKKFVTILNILYEYGLAPDKAMDKKDFIYFQEEIFDVLRK